MLSNDFSEIDKEAERLATAAAAKPNDPLHIALLISLEHCPVSINRM